MTKHKIYLFIASFFWGMGFLGIQGALNHGWGIFSMLALRGFLAGTIMLVIAFRVHLPWWNDKHFVKRAIFTGFVMWLGFVVQTYGQSLSNVSMASIITGLYVVFTPFIACFFKKQKLPLRVFVASFLAFGAIFLISYDGSGFTFGLGELMLLLAAFIYSVHFLLIESLGNYKIAFALSGIQLITMAVCSLIVMFIIGEGFRTEGLEYVLFLALICSGLAFGLQVLGQEKVNSSLSSLILSLESVFGVIGAIVLFNEPFSFQIVAGCTIMMLAIYLVEGKGK